MFLYIIKIVNKQKNKKKLGMQVGKGQDEEKWPEFNKRGRSERWLGEVVLNKWHKKKTPEFLYMLKFSNKVVVSKPLTITKIQ